MQLPPDSRFRLCESNDGSWQLLRGGERWMAYLGFDSESRRFISASFSSGIENCDSGIGSAVYQRLEGLLALDHPTIGKIHEIGETSFGNSYCVVELVEGEPLLEYLSRNPDLPEDLLACILLDLADALRVLAQYPRFLSCVDPNDFLVTLDRGIFPALRLGRFGLNREDQPISDFQLAERWTQITAGIHIAMREGSDPSSNQDQAWRHPRYAELAVALNRKSGVDAILHLNELNSAIRDVAGLGGDPGYAVPVEHRKLRHVKQVGKGPLQNMLFENGELETMIRGQYELRESDIRYGVSPFMIPAARLEAENQKGTTPEMLHLYLLPPERLFEESFIEPLNRKMFDGYLKSHPNGIRARSLICERYFTLLVADRFEGLPLPSFQARRARFSTGDALAIIRQLDRVLRQFESARFPIGRLSPWQVEVYFESVDPAEIPDLIEKTPIEDWPAWDLKLRVETPADIFVEPVSSAWSHLITRLNKRSFPAIFIWLLEGDRFEWALKSGQIQVEPLCWNPHIDGFLRSAALEFNDADPLHRGRLIEVFTDIFNRRVDPSECLKADEAGRFFAGADAVVGVERQQKRKPAEDKGSVR